MPNPRLPYPAISSKLHQTAPQPDKAVSVGRLAMSALMGKADVLAVPGLRYQLSIGEVISDIQLDALAQSVVVREHLLQATHEFEPSVLLFRVIEHDVELDHSFAEPVT